MYFDLKPYIVSNLLPLTTFVNCIVKWVCNKLNMCIFYEWMRLIVLLTYLEGSSYVVMLYEYSNTIIGSLN